MQRRLGFTLIEVMIVVAVLTILASIAYPSYTSYVKRSNRSAAQQLMLNISNRQEQYLLDMRKYANRVDTDATEGLNVKADGWNCSVSTCSNDFYDIAVAADVGPPPRYTITAVAKGNQLSDGDLSLNNIGVKTGKW